MSDSSKVGQAHPFEVDAIQILEGCGQEVAAFLGDNTWFEWIMADPEQPSIGYRLEGLRVAGREGVATLKPGDWIIREPNGAGFHPYVAEHFPPEATG